MSDKQPTPEQVVEFWKWCADKWVSFNIDKHRHYLFGSRWVEDPPIDLNNLWAYAVPKVLFCSLTYRGRNCYVAQVSNTPSQDIDFICGKSEGGVSDDPALALFWAIWRVVQEYPKVVMDAE